MKTLQRSFFYVMGGLMVIVALTPLLWAVLSTFKSNIEILRVPLRFFPEKWVFYNYEALLGNPAFLKSLLNTAFVATITTCFALIFSSMAAYAFARLEFPLKKILWVYTLIPLFVPTISILIPSYIIVSKLGIIDTLYVLILPFIVSVYGVFFFRQFYLNIPRDIEEAAVIDGASYAAIYLKILLPLSKPPFILIGVKTFLDLWNSYLWPILTISNQKLYQIMQMLSFFRGQYSQETGLWLSGSVIASLPVVMMFLVFQKHLIQGIKISGLK